MNNNTMYKNDPLATSENNVLKVTALFYIMDALFTEKYESCDELITLAKNFGASEDEISAIIAQFIKWLKGEYYYNSDEFSVILARE